VQAQPCRDSQNHMCMHLGPSARLSAGGVSGTAQQQGQQAALAGNPQQRAYSTRLTACCPACCLTRLPVLPACLPAIPPPCVPACRNLLDSYYLGRVIGAGSFGVVREGIKVATGKRFAVKTVSKVPKRGAPTPRCAFRATVCLDSRQEFVGKLKELECKDNRLIILHSVSVLLCDIGCSSVC
jgi:hypothetical protein